MAYFGTYFVKKKPIMKKLTALLTLALGLTQFASAQVTTVDCDMMNLVVNVSDTGLVKLYHPGHYLTHPQSENVIEWEVTDAAGNVIAQETLIDDSDFLFDFNTPLTEIMNVSAHLTNDSAIHNGFPVNCLIEDQLFWEVTEIVPGYISGRWEFLHGNVGVDQNEVSGIFDAAPAAAAMDNKIYDLYGRELSEAPFGQMYIQNKKKYIRFY